MVTSATSLGRNGVQDWLLQRASAVLMLAYTVCIVAFLMQHTPLTHSEWHGFMSTLRMRIFTSITLFAFVIHAWIGIWTVTTDYMKCTCIRLSTQFATFLWLAGGLIYGLVIVWGI